MIYEVKEADGDVHFFRLPDTAAVVIHHTKEGVLSFAFGHDGIGLQTMIADCQHIKIGTDEGFSTNLNFFKGVKR